MDKTQRRQRALKIAIVAMVIFVAVDFFWPEIKRIVAELAGMASATLSK